MMSEECTKCGSTDFTDSGKCRACQKVRNDAYRKKHMGGGSVTTKPKTTKVPAISVAVAGPALTIEPGYGLQAVIHDGYLQIRQEDDGAGETIMLSKAEARRLFEEFKEWAA